MKFARWRLRTILVVIAGLAVFCAGASKCRRYIDVRNRIASYSREEKALMDEYRLLTRISGYCGNPRQRAAACFRVADEFRCKREACEREIRRLW